MRKMLGALLLFAGIQSATAQNNVATPARAIEPVSFCDLIGHPDRYYGIPVRVTATYRAADPRTFLPYAPERGAVRHESKRSLGPRRS
jgi:hypothetical protein